MKIDKETQMMRDVPHREDGLIGLIELTIVKMKRQKTQIMRDYAALRRGRNKDYEDYMNFKRLK